MASIISSIKRNMKIARTRRKIQLSSDGDRPAVVVYQMGKVASSSIYASLLEREDLHAFHTHRLNPKAIFADEDTNFWNVDRRHRCSQDLSELLIQPKRDVKIITLFREPFARNISAFFETSPLINQKKYQDPEHLDELIEIFMGEVRHNSIRHWFDGELKESLGVDLLEHPFDAAKGIGRVKVGTFDVLTLSTAVSDAGKIEAIEDFLGIDNFTIQNTNRTDNKRKPVSDLYRAFKARVKYPKEIIDEVLADAYTQKLFTEKEIAEMRDRWSA